MPIIASAAKAASAVSAAAHSIQTTRVAIVASSKATELVSKGATKPTAIAKAIEFIKTGNPNISNKQVQVAKQAAVKAVRGK